MTEVSRNSLARALDGSELLSIARVTPPSRVSGLMGPARSLVEAVLATSRKGPVVVVVPDERRLPPAASDLSSFLHALGSDRRVLPFPAFALDPYRGLSPHLDVVAARLKALAAILAREDVVVLASAPAVLYRTAEPSVLKRSIRALRPKDTVDPLELERFFVLGGYRYEDPVTTPGDFTRRGGILDVFPTASEWPVRVELIGDEIEEIRTFDPESQRAREKLAVAEIGPASEWPVSEESLRALGGDEALSRAGVGFLVPILPQYQASLFDYLAPDDLFIAEEPASIAHAAESEWERVLTSYAEADDLDRSRYAEPVKLLLDLGELDSRIESRAVSLREMGILGEDTHHLSTHILPSYRGRVSEFLGEVRARLDSGQQVRVFAGGEGMAERCVELFAEAGIAAGRTADDSRGVVHLELGSLSQSFAVPSLALAILTASDVFAEPPRPTARRGLKLGRFLSDFRDLKVGDYVVHTDHGIGVFVGLSRLEEPSARAQREPKASRDLPSQRFGGSAEARRAEAEARAAGVGPRGTETDPSAPAEPEPQGSLPQRFSTNRRGGTELVALEYLGGDKLYVPVDRLDLLEKYSSSEGKRPRLDKLGGTGWERVKRRVRKSMRDMAQELLRLYAQRKAAPGYAFSLDNPWMREFEGLFAFEETPDQRQAIEDVKRDMETPSPMDRLICGDVGYGKTEVAMRAAFKTVSDGKQVAVLVPTTVLASQHLATFQERFAPFPVRIEMLSRFRSRKEQKATLDDLAAGKVDIVIGTHRLLSKDVSFADLGLLVVDEEQRFGVSHKERLKALRHGVDALALTATPIPRTLHMSLSGIRDLSVIETPPKDRMAIQTHISRLDSKVLSEAIRYELGRGGQVYFVHNRVGSIYSMANYLKRLVPEARIVVGHGQMREHELEAVMLSFIRGEFDILVSTTIIENGLDIPRVNTLIVNRADRYGLSQLYQLRGRVGRSNVRAYAYFLVPEETHLTPLARRRLAAIREFSELGAGFRIAALDLELRGAGNLLGGEQHGHIDAVGFDLYCRLLDETVSELETGEAPAAARANLNLRIELRIPEEFIPDMNQRMSIYKRASSANDRETLERLQDETRDRYGPLPERLLQFFEYGRLKVLANDIGLSGIERERGKLAFRLGPGARLSAANLARLATGLDEASVASEGETVVLRIPLAAGSEASEVLSGVREVLLRLDRYSKMT
jgi:transcription-repair coupling factor (superfamily II helicase)